MSSCKCKNLCEGTHLDPNCIKCCNDCEQLDCDYPQSLCKKNPEYTEDDAFGGPSMCIPANNLNNGPPCNQDSDCGMYKWCHETNCQDLPTQWNKLYYDHLIKHHERIAETPETSKCIVNNLTQKIENPQYINDPRNARMYSELIENCIENPTKYNVESKFSQKIKIPCKSDNDCPEDTPSWCKEEICQDFPTKWTNDFYNAVLRETLKTVANKEIALCTVNNITKEIPNPQDIINNQDKATDIALKCNNDALENNIKPILYKSEDGKGDGKGDDKGDGKGDGKGDDKGDGKGDGNRFVIFGLITLIVILIIGFLLYQNFSNKKMRR